LGYFVTENEAIKIRKQAQDKYFGEFQYKEWENEIKTCIRLTFYINK
jgi:fructose-1,6-bisphosphatase